MIHSYFFGGGKWCVQTLFVIFREPVDLSHERFK